MDYPNIHKLIYQGIQQSPMDARKHIYRLLFKIDLGEMRWGGGG